MSGAGAAAGAARYETVSAELFTLTYGAVVAQVVRDFEDPKEANAQLEAMGYNLGVRIVDDFCAKSRAVRCRATHSGKIGGACAACDSASAVATASGSAQLRGQAAHAAAAAAAAEADPYTSSSGSPDEASSAPRGCRPSDVGSPSASNTPRSLA